MASTFEKELQEIMHYVENAVSRILLSEDRTSKHKPWTWLEENEDEHLRKASRHILTYKLIRDRQQKDDGENHLDNAIARLSMAVAHKALKILKMEKWEEGKYYWVTPDKYSKPQPMLYSKEFGFFHGGSCYFNPFSVGKKIEE